MTQTTLPTASLFDVEEQAEGSLDPLGTYNISEILASRIGSPGVRERQRNLRFLTLCCIGWETIASIDAEVKPGDPSATLEQAFEWLVVEALVAGDRNDGSPKLGSLPGINKARACIQTGLHLNADRYLRTASVFGFFGVYRTLAEYISLVVPRSDEAPLLGPEGSRLLSVWRHEQAMEGFGRGLRGRGQKEYVMLVDALEATWQAGQAVPNKQSSAVIQSYLQPLCPGGRKEEIELIRLITESGQKEDDRHRREVLRALENEKVKELMFARAPDAEMRFHEHLRKSASPSLMVLLNAVKAYEAFIRPLHDLFEDLLFALSDQPKLISLGEISAVVPKLNVKVQAIPSLYHSAVISLRKIGGLGVRFEEEFGHLSQVMTGENYLGALLFHHEKVQKKKPPSGKSPWIEHPDHRVAVRPLYRRKNGASREPGYVYFYRARPLFDLVRGARGQYGQE